VGRKSGKKRFGMDEWGWVGSEARRDATSSEVVRGIAGGVSCGRHDVVMNWKLGVVSGLNQACLLVDEVAYRPAIVRLTLPLPRWWRCELAKLSVWLDRRWGLEYWGGDSDLRTMAPGQLCDVCHRRPTSLEAGEVAVDLGDEETGDYMESHPLKMCFWCKLPESPIESDKQLAAAIAASRAESISWRWRWR